MVRSCEPPTYRLRRLRQKRYRERKQARQDMPIKSEANKSDRVYLSDVRRHNWCVQGCRQWGKRHGLDYEQFVKHGLSFDELLATNSVAAHRIIRLVTADRANARLSMSKPNGQ